MPRTAAGAIVLALLWAVPAGAQELEHGTWTGSLVPPGPSAEPVPVTFEVQEADGALSIVMRNEILGEAPFSDERLEGDQLTFWWEPGIRVDCALTRQGDGSFEGTCQDDRGTDGGQGTISMRPPEG